MPVRALGSWRARSRARASSLGLLGRSDIRSRAYGLPARLATGATRPAARPRSFSATARSRLHASDTQHGVDEIDVFDGLDDVVVVAGGEAVGAMLLHRVGGERDDG